MNNYERLEKDGKIKALVYNLCTSAPEDVKAMYNIPKNLSIEEWLRKPRVEEYVKLEDVVKLINDETDECFRCINKIMEDPHTQFQEYYIETISTGLWNIRNKIYNINRRELTNDT